VIRDRHWQSKDTSKMSRRVISMMIIHPFDNKEQLPLYHKPLQLPHLLTQHADLPTSQSGCAYSREGRAILA
jgi:hypothetical protein